MTMVKVSGNDNDENEKNGDDISSAMTTMIVVEEGRGRTR